MSITANVLFVFCQTCKSTFAKFNVLFVFVKQSITATVLPGFAKLLCLSLQMYCLFCQLMYIAATVLFAFPRPICLLLQTVLFDFVKPILCCLVLSNMPTSFSSLGRLSPVVQSVVSLTSSLRVISLTVLADSIHNILIFFAEKM